MRILLLLLVLAVTGLTLAQWLGKPPAPAVPKQAPSDTPMPVVPTRPQDVKAFERDLNRFMQDAAKQRDREDSR